MSRDRFEAMATKEFDKWQADRTDTRGVLAITTLLLRREHAALVRAVKRLSTTHPAGLSIEDVLALLAKQKGRTRCD